jgi:hypothetical protein
MTPVAAPGNGESDTCGGRWSVSTASVTQLTTTPDPSASATVPLPALIVQVCAGLPGWVLTPTR